MSHNPTNVRQYILPSAFLVEVKPGCSAHVQEFFRCRAFEVKQIVIVQIDLKEAHIMLCSMDDYNTVRNVSISSRSFLEGVLGRARKSSPLGLRNKKVYLCCALPAELHNLLARPSQIICAKHSSEIIGLPSSIH